MKNIIKTLSLTLIIISANKGFSQDTLHLDFKATQTVPDKVIEDKIVAWGKTLNGKKQDINIVAYYHKGEFKKFAEQRLEEMFLSVNRKVRELVNIKTQEAVKGDDYQRTRVDIIYWPEGQDAKTMAAKKKADEKAAKEAAEKKKKDDEKLAKDAKDKDAKDKKGGSSTTAKGDDKKVDKKAEELAKKEAEARKKERFEKYGVKPTKTAGQGDFVKDKEVKAIKECKLIVAEFGLEKADKDMMEAVKNYWTFTTDVSSMPYKQAKEMAKKDDKIMIMYFTTATSKSLKHDGAFNTEYQFVSTGGMMVIENAKGGVMVNSYIPLFGEGGITPEILAFGVTNINYLLKTMEDKNLGSNLKYEGAYKENSPALKSRKLLIPEGWISAKFDKAEISKLYTGEYEVVSYERWRDAILNKENVAYTIIVPRSVGGKFLYHHFLMDAGKCMVYAVITPTGASLDLGGNNINLSKGNTGFINEKNIKKYNDALSGDW